MRKWIDAEDKSYTLNALTKVQFFNIIPIFTT